jgi:hypothetical protein
MPRNATAIAVIRTKKLSHHPPVREYTSYLPTCKCAQVSGTRRAPAKKA